MAHGTWGWGQDHGLDQSPRLPALQVLRAWGQLRHVATWRDMACHEGGAKHEAPSEDLRGCSPPPLKLKRYLFEKKLYNLLTAHAALDPLLSSFTPQAFYK